MAFIFMIIYFKDAHMLQLIEACGSKKKRLILIAENLLFFTPTLKRKHQEWQHQILLND